MSPSKLQETFESKCDLKILNFFIKFGRLGGLVPLKSRRKNFVFNTFMLFLHIFAMGNFYNMITYHQNILPGKAIHLGVTILIFLSYYFLYVFSSWRALHNRKRLIRLLKNIQCFQKVMKNLNNRTKSNFVYFSEPIVYHLLFLILKCSQVKKYSFSMPNLGGSLLFLYGMVFNYLKFLMILIITFLQRVTLNRYQIFNLNLKFVFEECDISRSNLAEKMANLKRPYFYLADTVAQINILFEFQSMCIITQAFLYTLICFNSMVSIRLDQESEKYQSESFLVDFYASETFLTCVS